MYFLAESLRVPPNVKFEIDDAEETWTFREKFDLIHLRYLAAALKDWPRLASQCFEHTAPGGWTEIQDFDLQYYSEDGSMTNNHSIKQWIDYCIRAAKDFGREPQPGLKAERHLKEAGFVNVGHSKYRLPIGPWARDKHLVSFHQRLGKTKPSRHFWLMRL